jgi:ABC-type polysaccharide/polyol phosphate export permease
MVQPDTRMSMPSQIPVSGPKTGASDASADLVGGLLRADLWGRIGWLEIKRRYRRTTLGPFWSSCTLAVYTLAVGIVGAGLFHQDAHEYLPYLSSGMIVWTFISTMILESCTLFVIGNALFRNVRFEYSILAYALVWRNFVIFLHNLVVFLIIALVLKPELISFTALTAAFGVLIVLINGVWIGLLVGILCLRFRDIQPIVQTLIQIWTLITPIFWTPSGLSGPSQFVFVQLNPIYRLIDVVRSPLLGTVPTEASYAAAFLITIVGWGLTYVAFRLFRKRISYWS